MSGVNDKKRCVRKMFPQGFDFNILSGTWYKYIPDTLGQIPYGKGSSFLMGNGFFCGYIPHLKLIYI